MNNKEVSLTMGDASATYVQVLALLCGVGGQADPLDFLLLLGDDVHGHEHVEGVVHAPPDVLLVVRLQAETPGVLEGN